VSRTWRSPAAPACAGVAAAAVGGGYVLARHARRWQADPEDLEAAGLVLPRDVVHHQVPTSDGGSLHVVERGFGHPLVLVHGVMLGVEIWAPQFRRLSGHRRVLAVGQRGHGSSVAGDGGYSMARLADDLLEVLARLEVSDAVLVGHSMGGMVALVSAVDRARELRRHVRSLVLVGTSAGPLVPGAARGLVGAAVAGAASRGLRRSERRGQPILPGQELGAWLARVSFGARPGAAEVALTRAVLDRMSPGAMAALLGPLLAYDVHRRIHVVDLPTRVVVGTRDVLTPPAMARAITREIPGAELEVLAGCGHMVMLERAEELGDLLDEAAAATAGGG
jgi:pimeloyl-ACP methyl ester carboxylesterase